MLELPRISFINREHYPGIKKDFVENKFVILRLDGQKVSDTESFFKYYSDELPNDPPMRGVVHWDGFIDSAWEGIANLNAENVAIVWEDVDNILKNHPEHLYEILDCVNEVAEQLKEARGLPFSVNLKIILIGKRENVPTDPPHLLHVITFVE